MSRSKLLAVRLCHHGLMSLRPGCQSSAVVRWSSKASFSTKAEAVEEVDLSSWSITSPDALADAIRPHFEAQTPVVLRGAVARAPATLKWTSLEYWKDTLPPNEMGAVEIGGSYSSGLIDRAEIPLQDYLAYLDFFEERHGRIGSSDPLERPTTIANEELVYMAQNDLPQALYKDITIPGFCEDESYQVGLGRLYSVMLWLGPRGCVSPLHYDPLDNALMQFMGRKVVWLYEPKPGVWHYAGQDGQQSNTSPVNPEDEDLEATYPLFRKGGPPAIRCVLDAGDVLFIPSKWWHFVRSLETSASVNVWWR